MHEPVLLAEVVDLIRPHADGIYVDCTVGWGGHAQALLEAGAGRVIGIDRDEAALSQTRTRLSAMADRLELVHGDYRQLAEVLRDRRIDRVHGVLVDLGVSSMQLDDPGRGFSFRQDGPLDMRMNPSSGPTAADLIASADETTLADVIYRFGEERHARRIARGIVRAREARPITRTTDLASIARRAAGGRGYQRIDPATRTFQAIRIWVNGELDGLETFLETGADRLAAGGRFAAIAFHSLEDRIVKHTFRRLAEAPAAVRLLTRKPLTAGDDEIRRNPRARSARLRAVEKIA